jgi:endonuclease YncB( thermonuclease family)
MVAQGFAFSYKQYPTKYLNEFNKLEQVAREKNLGYGINVSENFQDQ